MNLSKPSPLPKRGDSLRRKIFPFLHWIDLINSKTLKADFTAALTGAFIVLPQGISFAMIAGLPAAYGLYTAMVPVVIAAMFGSSRHLVSGPTTALSLIIFSTLSQLAEPGSAQYISLVLTLTFLAGVFQLAFGLARLGTALNFVSHSVIVGFSAGAAVLIATGQLKYALGINVPGGSSFLTTWFILLKSSGQINLFESAIALSTFSLGMAIKHYLPRWPGLLIAMIMGGFLAVALNGHEHGVRFLGEISGNLPPFSMPALDLDSLRLIAPGALAVALLGLIEASSISRSISVKSRQQIDGSQEFIGQGLSNIIGSFFSAYASSGSFTRSGVNYDSGAATPMSAIFSAVFLTAVTMLAASLSVWIPLSAMGGVILVVALRLIDVSHIKEILKSSRAETAIFSATFLGTLLFEIEFAIYAGVLLSLAIYLVRMSHPRIHKVVPQKDSASGRLDDFGGDGSPECPQMKIIRIDGSLFFGAASHVTEYLEKMDMELPGHLLIVGYGINYIDISGATALVQERQRRRALGKNIYFSSLNREIIHFLEHGDYMREINIENVFDNEQTALGLIVPELDLQVCETCTSRIFRECPEPGKIG